MNHILEQKLWKPDLFFVKNGMFVLSTMTEDCKMPLKGDCNITSPYRGRSANETLFYGHPSEARAKWIEEMDWTGQII